MPLCSSRQRSAKIAAVHQMQGRGAAVAGKPRRAGRASTCLGRGERDEQGTHAGGDGPLTPGRSRRRQNLGRAVKISSQQRDGDYSQRGDEQEGMPELEPQND